MLFLKGAGYAVIALCMSAIGFADDKEPLLISPFEQTDISMRELVDFLRSKGVPLNFEECPMTWDDGISYQKVLDTIGKKETETLTEREKWWLEMANKHKTDSPDQLATIFHYHEERFDLETTEKRSVSDILKQAIQKDLRYRIREGKERHAVVPAKNEYREKNMLIMPPTLLGEAIFKLGRDVTEPNGFGHALIFQGPKAGSYLASKKKVSFSLFEVSVYEVMDEFTKTMSGVQKAEFAWTIGGYAESRHFGFFSIGKAK